MIRHWTAIRWLCPIVAALAISGCISVGGSSASKNDPPTSTYTLHAASSGKPDSAGPKGAAVIVVPTPEVPTGFDTEKIALYFEQGRQLDYYANAQWSGRLDELLRDFIVQTARHEFPGKTVGTTDLSNSPRYKLVVKILDFQPVYSGGPDGVPRLDVAMTMTLIELPGGKVKANASAKKSAQASANRMTIVTKELEGLLQAATHQALHEIAPYVAEH
jgi:ABC-type uncharacterized transport system auxiliary subunit